ncbi:hypothetical protein [Ramlibacter sp.]|uniref:hypothetical protein n=1 Tax=Ramlibacter sp. TaxID=1917967 RepID=UPI003D0C4F0E
MFDKLRKVFSRDAGREPSAGADADNPVSQFHAPVSRWAQAHGFAVTLQGKGQTLSMQGRVEGKRWTLELGKPSRNYIQGEELRARAELGLNEDAAVLVINRPLKEALERKAYDMITNDLRTTADPNLPEEMRWLAMYEEVGWDSLPRAFWDRYAVLADRKDNALAWIDPQLAQQLLDWPGKGVPADVPFMMLVLRGKAYLRMEFRPASPALVEHVAELFASACESAIGGLSTDLAI